VIVESKLGEDLNLDSTITRKIFIKLYLKFLEKSRLSYYDR